MPLFYTPGDNDISNYLSIDRDANRCYGPSLVYRMGKKVGPSVMGGQR